MRSMFFVVASLVSLAICASAPLDSDVIQQIPQKLEATPSATGKDVAKSGAAEKGLDASEPKTPEPRVRRDLGGQESDLLPSNKDVDDSPFSENLQLDGHNRIRVLPAFMG
ncbi:unnamed protein product [Parnassius apollo]|uniref:(apollo) hypothetical protein n=1 Tax=Parnassius apollo TaxID=110799 RepID=A0A8S3Y3X6_PARAO|nr:unnamed protein product [Parnassius apollo]